MISVLYIGNKLSGHGNTPTAIEVLGPLLENEGIKIEYASSKKNKRSRIVDMLWRTVVLRRTVNYVIIDTYSTYNFWYAFAVSQLCRMLKLKYIPILHGGGLPRRLSANPILSEMIFRNAFINIAPSGYLLDRFRSAGYNVKYIPNPVETDLFPFLQRTAIRPSLLWVRSLVPIYNPSLILRVAAILKRELPDVKIMMVGPDKADLLPGLQKEANELGLDITFTGKLSKAEWAEKSIDYDIFVNTSHIDNAPYSLIEAAALGMPIVSTNVGGIPFIFENNKTALLTDDDDANAMALAIQLLISELDLHRTLIANGLILSEEFKWDKLKYKWLQILV